MRMSGALRPKWAVASRPSDSVSASASGLVGTAEGFDAALQEFTGQAAAVAENRAEIAIALRATGGRGGEIVARHRNGEIRPQAQFLAGPAGGQEHAAPDILAGQVQERLGGLQDGRIGPGIARALVSGDQGLRARVGQGGVTVFDMAAGL